jgi:hypothetical protein
LDAAAARVSVGNLALPLFSTSLPARSLLTEAPACEFDSSVRCCELHAPRIRVGLDIRCAANDTVEQALGDNGNQRRWFS